MAETQRIPAGLPTVLHVAAGDDRFGEHRGLGISTIDLKVTSQDAGGILILENTFHAKGGPARHLHYDQDEWFYAIEGEFIFEVGQERLTLKTRRFAVWGRARFLTSGPTLAKHAAGF